MTIPSEVLESVVTSAINLALTRLAEEGPSDEAMARFKARIEGIDYMVICNRSYASDSTGVHASLAMSNFMGIVERFARAPIDERKQLIHKLRGNR